MQKQKKWDKSKQCESDSLWNYTLSPGWTQQEVEILKNALMLYGIGRWKKIMESHCLPGKSIGQIYMQTQRLIGQQSLGEYMGLQVNLAQVYIDNMKKTSVLRKNNSIINTGDNPTREERKRRILENQKKYGLDQEFINTIQLPRFKNRSCMPFMNLESIENDKFTTLEIMDHLGNMKKLIEKKLKIIDEKEQDVALKRKVILNLRKFEEEKYEFDYIENFENEELILKDPLNINLIKLSKKKFKIANQ